MPTTFDYIENVVINDLNDQKANVRLSDEEKNKASKTAQKIIAGFRVKDEAAERAMLDKVVNAKIRSIEIFMSSRKAITDSLKSDGVEPLAVIPTETWEKLCRQSGLFIFTPDNKSRIGYDRSSLYGAYKANVASAKRAWNQDKTSFLRNMFPTGKAGMASQYHAVTLILPDPPKEVADILCRAQKHPLKVAAVAEAISFAEAIGDIIDQSSYTEKDLWARNLGYEDYADWVKRDPIVFTEFGPATAIIAQFGEFPIEKAIVDSVVKANETIKADAVPEVVAATNVGVPAQIYSSSLIAIPQQIHWVEQNLMGQSQGTFNSSAWTGR